MITTLRSSALCMGLTLAILSLASNGYAGCFGEGEDLEDRYVRSQVVNIISHVPKGERPDPLIRREFPPAKGTYELFASWVNYVRTVYMGCLRLTDSNVHIVMLFIKYQRKPFSIYKTESCFPPEDIARSITLIDTDKEFGIRTIMVRLKDKGCRVHRMRFGVLEEEECTQRCKDPPFKKKSRSTWTNGWRMFQSTFKRRRVKGGTGSMEASSMAASSAMSSSAMSNSADDNSIRKQWWKNEVQEPRRAERRAEAAETSRVGGYSGGGGFRLPPHIPHSSSHHSSTYHHSYSRHHHSPHHLGYPPPDDYYLYYPTYYQNTNNPVDQAIQDFMNNCVKALCCLWMCDEGCGDGDGGGGGGLCNAVGDCLGGICTGLGACLGGIGDCAENIVNCLCCCLTDPNCNLNLD